jgi:DNA-binding beta-propeller fold protein YncE
VCGFNTSMVTEIDPTTGNVLSSWSTPFGTRPNDLAFMPDGRIIVTTMDFTNGPGPGNMAWVYDPSYNLIANFAGTGWGRVHGIDISPLDGNIYIADGITAQVHVFDATTYTELNAMFLNPHPIGKIVDVEFEVVPAPGSLLVVAGLAGLGRRRRRH